MDVTRRGFIGWLMTALGLGAVARLHAEPSPKGEGLAKPVRKRANAELRFRAALPNGVRALWEPDADAIRVSWAVGDTTLYVFVTAEAVEADPERTAEWVMRELRSALPSLPNGGVWGECAREFSGLESWLPDGSGPWFGERQAPVTAAGKIALVEDMLRCPYGPLITLEEDVVVTARKLLS